MASGPIISLEIHGERVAIVSDFVLGGSKMTADGECSHEIKRHLLLGRKVMTNLGSILKSRDITMPTKVHLIKTMVFPVVMYDGRVEFIYLCWNSTACCSLLTWAEINCVKQLIIYEEIIISISMMITRASRSICQLQIAPNQEKYLPKRDCGLTEDSQARSLRCCSIWMFFLRTVKLSSTRLVVFTQTQHVTFKMVQATSCGQETCVLSIL